MGFNLDKKEIDNRVPSTRYRGSKRRILPWIFENVSSLKFDTVLDGFGGTGSVSYLFKMMGKEVTFNDILTSNYQTGISFIENGRYILNKHNIQFLTQSNDYEYPTFIQDTFGDIYYLDEENAWLDRTIYNIKMLSDRYSGEVLRKKQALAYHALFQACLMKRPYNLFHRKNLYMRTAQVKRTFYNKKTWEIPFEDLFVRYCIDTSKRVFQGRKRNRAVCQDILNLNGDNFDLVYLDPPYVQVKSESVNYYNFYHFLEGIVDYDNWAHRLDLSRKHYPLQQTERSWVRGNVEKDLDRVFQRYSDSIIVMSYGEPGYPSIEVLTEMLGQYKEDVQVFKRKFSYSLNRSKKNGNGLYEVLIVAQK